MSRAHDIQLFAGSFCSSWCEKLDCKQAGSPKVCMELRFRDNTGATWAQKGTGVAGEQPIFTFSGQHTTKRDTFKKAAAGVGGKAVVTVSLATACLVLKYPCLDTLFTESPSETGSSPAALGRNQHWKRL